MGKPQLFIFLAELYEINWREKKKQHKKTTKQTKKQQNHINFASNQHFRNALRTFEL